MAASSHNTNAYTDQEKKFLIGPLLVGTIAVTVFLYVYFTIPSRPYELHEAPHGAAHSTGDAAAHQQGGGHAPPSKEAAHPQEPDQAAPAAAPKH